MLELYYYFCAVFSRLQRRQAQFFQEASAGLLSLMRLAAQDDGDDDGGEEEDEASVQAMDGHSMVPLKQVRAALVDDIVQVAQVVRETCDAVNVSVFFSFKDCTCSHVSSSFGGFMLYCQNIHKNSFIICLYEP